MRHIELTPESRLQLERLRKEDCRYRVRDRAHALLLSDLGQSIDDLALFFNVTRDTISDWFNRWEAGSYAGLVDAPHPGRPPKLSESEKKR
jgi:transposase